MARLYIMAKHDPITPAVATPTEDANTRPRKTTVLRIAKWASEFETDKSRRSATAFSWLRFPINFNSNGRLQMVEDFGNEFATFYGAWTNLLLISALVQPRGYLVDGKGKPISTGRMQLISHIDAAVFDRLIDWCLRPDVQWIEEIDAGDLQSLIDRPLIDGQSIDDRPAVALTIQQNKSKKTTTIQGGCGVEFSDLEVDKQARRFRERSACGVREVTKTTLDEFVRFALTHDPRLIDSAAAKCLKTQIKNPDGYLHGIMRNYQ